MLLHPHPRRWWGTIHTYLHESFGVGGLAVMPCTHRWWGSLGVGVEGSWRKKHIILAVFCSLAPFCALGLSCTHCSLVLLHLYSLVFSCTLTPLVPLVPSITLVPSIALLHPLCSYTLLQEHLWPDARASTPKRTSTTRHKSFHEQVGLSLSHEHIQ